MEWNPNTTATKGQEWFPTDEIDFVLAGPSKIAAQSMVNSAVQTIQDANFMVALRAPGDQPATLFLCEVYDEETGAIDTASLVSSIYVPTADVAGVASAGGFTDQAGGVANIFNRIDEQPVDLTDYIKCVDAAGGLVTAQYSCRTSAATLTGKRLLAVTLTAVVSRTAGYASRFRLFLDLAGTRYFSPYYQPAADAVQTITYTWYFSPAANRPWRIADVDLFKTASTDEIGIEAEAKGNEARCYQLLLTVPNCTENRIAVGTLLQPITTASPAVYTDRTTGTNYSVPVGLTIPMVTPIGGAWTKEGTTRHLWTLRTLSGSKAYVLPALVAATAAPSARMFPTVVNAQFGFIAAMGTAQPRAFPLGLRTTTASTVSVDSQSNLPYSLEGGTSGERGPVDTSLSSTNAVGQEFSNAAAANYQLVRFLVCRRDLLPTDDSIYTPNPVTGDITIKVRRKSDNVVMGGGQATVTAAQIAAQTALPGPRRFRLMEAMLSAPAPLAAATQYYLEFTTVAPAGAYRLARGLAEIVPVTFRDASFGGTTDAMLTGAAAPPTTRDTESDLYATLQTVPTAPANFLVAIANQALPDQGDALIGDCNIVGIDYAHLTWTATALGGSFLRYEIERSEDGGVTWTQLATIALEATVSYDDRGGLRETATRYRIRVIRTDLSFSAWSTSTDFTPHAAGCELILVSDVDATYNCAYQQIGDAVDFSVLDADDVVFRKPYGRNRQLAYTPTERRGVSYSLALRVFAGETAAPTPPTQNGLPIFDRLRALALLDVPYVIALDSQGHRLFVELQVPDVHIESRQPWMFAADVVLTEVDTGVVVVAA